MSAIVVAGTGARVVKHGNRASSSASGASDVLEKLGVNLELPPDRVAGMADEAGITFCFAVRFHPALRHVAVARKELGVATPFNFLGPLTNPARVGAQATGVADARMAPIVAGVLAARGSSALVFRGDDGLDELTTTATSTVWTVRDGTVREETFDPRDVGVELVPVEALRGADAAYNADVARRLLEGERGPVRDAVLLNSAAALAALDPTDAPLSEQIAAGMARAAESLDSGAARACGAGAVGGGQQPRLGRPGRRPPAAAPGGGRGPARFPARAAHTASGHPPLRRIPAARPPPARSGPASASGAWRGWPVRTPSGPGSRPVPAAGAARSARRGRTCP